ncbi:3723_t:CDS:1, partial [Ambispora leptoticha]
EQKEKRAEPRLRKIAPKPSTTAPMSIEESSTPLPSKRIVNKRLPSVVDKLDPYNIAEDLLSMQARATYGQLLQYPNQRRNLAKAVRRTKAPTTEANYSQASAKQKTIAMRCHVRIKGNPAVAILDSGAAVSIITNRLMEKLGLVIDKPSNTIVKTANGNKTKALGIVSEVRIALQ